MLLPGEEYLLLKIANQSNIITFFYYSSEIIYLLFFSWLILVWTKLKKHFFFFYFLFLVLTFATVSIMKELFQQPRPYLILNLLNFPFSKDSFSFPSAHSALAFYLAFSLSHLLKNKALKIIIFGIASFIAISRVLSLMHSLTDVVIGALIGIYFAKLASSQKQTLEVIKKLIFQNYLLRKIIHILAGSLIAILNLFSLNLALSFSFISLLIVIFAFGFLKPKSQKLSNFFNFLDYHKDAKTFPAQGAIALFTSSILTLLLFPREIASASILALSLGDGFAGILGTLGKTKIKLTSKTLEGFLAFWIGSFLSFTILFDPTKSLIASLILAIFELPEIKIKKLTISDNFYLPLIGAFMLSLLKG